MTSTEILEAWSAWSSESRPYVLDADRDALLSGANRSAIVERYGWREAHEAEDFGAPGDTRLHLGLIPQPFCGDIRNASIYVLLLNPGLGPSDYYGEAEVPEFRSALFDNLKQVFGSRLPFMFLDPQFSWHGGYTWWHGKFARLIERLARETRETFAAARARLARELASIELVPYHSAKFNDRGRWIQRLESVRLARECVSGLVLRRVQCGEAIVVVTRQVAAWRLESQPGVILYTAQQSRAAHLTPDSPGGMAILDHLLKAQ
jgi:hypothetical protein